MTVASFDDTDGKDHTCGDFVESGGKVIFSVKVPSSASIRLLRDGQIVHSKSGTSLKYEAETPGLYRVEAYKGRRGWIFSNHIRVETTG